ncbi:MAG TPA: DEAD/DEAH box helicase [Bacteroidota bacterium]|nr:DEAD/DEAH box helicase [Bacteroidota bacterium]
MSFSQFGLSAKLLSGVHDAGYTEPTRIQTLAIPPALEGKDVIGCAQTGTGKTAAFVLPILHRILQNPRSGQSKQPRALVLAPTRELAQQVHGAFDMFGRAVSVQSVCVFGGAGIESQIKLLRRACDVLVATPGRLLDHIDRRTVDLSKVEFLVLDEADRMLDMGFIHDVSKIIALIPKQRQTMLFSATVSDEVASLSSKFLRSPVRVDAGGRHNPVESVSQSFYSATRDTKMGMLLHALGSTSMESVLIFSRTKHGADKISRRLEKTGIPSAAIHANRSQSQREKALAGFREGRYRVLVATDIAARGIDVVGISHVVNYDIPQEGETYVHRIGRTGRAGAAGEAITFVASEDRQYMRRIEQFTGKRIAVAAYPAAIVAVRPEVEVPSERTHTVKHRNSSSSRATSPGRDGSSRKRGPSVPREKKRHDIMTARRKTPAKHLDTFSTDRDGGAWSNY